MIVLTQRFEPEFASVGLARRAATRALQAQGLAWLQDEVGSVVSELATNAVLHAQSVYTVVLERHATSLRVSVVDDSPVLPRPPRSEDADSTTGRGLHLVAALSTAWGVLSPTTTGGKQTWCELPASRPDDQSPLAAPSDTEHQDTTGPIAAIEVQALLTAFDDPALDDAAFDDPAFDEPPEEPPRLPPVSPASTTGRGTTGATGPARPVGVRLVGVPLLLRQRSQQHGADLLREMTLLRAGQIGDHDGNVPPSAAGDRALPSQTPGQTPGEATAAGRVPAGEQVASRLLQLAQELERVYGPYVAAGNEQMDQALDRGQDQLDVTYELPTVRRPDQSAARRGRAVLRPRRLPARPGPAAGHRRLPGLVDRAGPAADRRGTADVLAGLDRPPGDRMTAPTPAAGTQPTRDKRRHTT